MRLALRIALLALGLPQIAIGVWALASPKGWHDTFPGLGRHWLDNYGPYNQHLSTDVGATFLAIGTLLLIAVWLLDHRTVVIALVVYLVYAIPHTAFHLLNDNVLTTGERVFDGIVLTATVLGSAGLIWVSGLISRSAHTSAP
ncbi:MAG: hypothetical protein M3Q98_09040 [Actinomycetota bacterium]|nr:hypothetical protein [Actinomycetota bacterium]